MGIYEWECTNVMFVECGMYEWECSLDECTSVQLNVLCGLDANVCT